MNVLETKNLRHLFSLVHRLHGVVQTERNHPEGDAFVHTAQVLRRAFRESKDVDLILAAMLHDVGKSVDMLGHDKEGADMVEGYVSEKAHWLVKQHMRFWYLIKGEMRKYSKVQYLATHPWLSDLAMLARWDKMGRNPNAMLVWDETYIIDQLQGLARKRQHFYQIWRRK